MELMEPWDPLDHPARIEIRRQDSSDSDAEGGLGNVTRIVLRPPGHSGKAKRGHLSFDASFETGNLGRVDFVSEFEYDLFVRPDTCNPRYRMWFNFVVDNVRADQRVIFNIVNFSKTRTLFCNGMTPLVKTTSRPKWQRLGGKYVYYHKSPEHRNHYILTFAFVFDREEDVYQFAFTMPYSYARLETHLGYILERSLPFVTIQTVALTLQNRKVEAVTICSPKILSKKPKTVVIMARIHPGESPTSFVAEGLIDFMISSHPLAGILRDYIIIKVIPMVNPDGVFIGNHRASLMGYDLNRHWNQISPWSHPVLSALKAYFQQLDGSKTLELDMIFDLHAHTSLLGTFVYGNSYEDVYRFERHILFPKLLAHNAEDYNPTYTMYNRDPHKVGTARRHLCDTLRSSVNVYSLEVSVHGYPQNNGSGTTSTVPYTEEGYFRLGRNIVRTLAEYYRVTGLIPVSAFPTKAPKPSEEEKKRIVRRSRSRSRPPTQGNEKPEAEEAPRIPEEDIIKTSKESIDDDDPASDDSLSSRGSSDHEASSDCRQSLSKESQLQSESEKMVEQRPPLTKSQSVPSRKLAYRTFDFSLLSSEGSPRQSPSAGSVESGSSGGRKVGGGGILGKQKTHRISKPSRKWTSEFVQTSSPSLTIIDFNLLIRAGLEKRTEGENADTEAKQKDGRGSRAYHRRRRGMNVRAVVTDWENTSSDSENEGQFFNPYRQQYRSAPVQLNCQSILNEKMTLNPRDTIRKPRKK